MRRFVIGLSGLMLAASTGCSVCQSYLDCEYAAYGGRWDRGAVAEHGDRTHRIAGRVGSEFHPAEAIRPADDAGELIPPGTPLTDEDDAPSRPAGDGTASDGAAGEGAAGEGPDAGASNAAGDGDATPLTPPAPEREKAKPAPAPPGRASAAPAKKAAKANAAGRAPSRTQETNWAAKPARPAARVRQTPANETPANETLEADAPATDEPAGDAGALSDDAAAPSTEAGDEAMTDGSESDASGALLQPPANE